MNTTMRAWAHSWLLGAVVALVGLGLIAGDVGCDAGEHAYDQSHQSSKWEKSHPASPGGRTTGKHLSDQTQQNFNIFGDPNRHSQPNQPSSSPGSLQPNDVSDKELAVFAQLHTQIQKARAKTQKQNQPTGNVGGGPAAPAPLTSREKQMIGNSPMSLDRYLAIRSLLDKSPELRQRLQNLVQKDQRK